MEIGLPRPRRIDTLLEKFSAMRDAFDRERKTVTRLWAKREDR